MKNIFKIFGSVNDNGEVVGLNNKKKNYIIYARKNVNSFL